MHSFNPITSQSEHNSVIQDHLTQSIYSSRRISPISLKTDLLTSAGPSSDGAPSSSGQVSPLSYSGIMRQQKNLSGYSKPSTSSRKSPTNARNSLKCPYCNKVFSNSSAIAKHKLTHSDERKYVCNICNKAFKRQDHLNGHKLTHESKKPHACKFCDKSYSDARSLKRHYENLHAEELERIKSRTTSQFTGNGSNDENSQQTGASDSSLLYNPLEEPKLSKCSICEKRFKNQSALNGHMRLHGGYTMRSDANSPHSNESLASDQAGPNNESPLSKPFSTYIPFGQVSQTINQPTTSINTLDHLLNTLNSSPNISPLRSGLSSNVSPNPALDPNLLQNSPFSHDLMDLEFSPCTTSNNEPQKDNPGSNLIGQYSLADYQPVTNKSIELNNALIHADPTLTDLNAGVSNFHSQQHQQLGRYQSVSSNSFVGHNLGLPTPSPILLQIDQAAANREKLIAMETNMTHQQEQQQRHLLNNITHYQINPNYYIQQLTSSSQQPNMTPTHASLLQSASQMRMDDYAKLSSTVPKLHSQLGSNVHVDLNRHLAHEALYGNNQLLDKSICDLETSGDLFRNPNTPPLTKKPKKKPAPLFIPPQAGINLSRLRSPRYCDPNRSQAQFSPPPYTPPPMLSPVRRGTGLFYSIKRGISTPSAGGNTPVTPRLSSSMSGVSLSSEVQSTHQEKQKTEISSPCSDIVSNIKQEQLRSPDMQLISPSAIKKSSTPSPHPASSSKSGASPSTGETIMFRYGEEMPQALSENEDMETDDGIPTCVMPMINLGPNYQADVPEFCHSKRTYQEASKEDTRLFEVLLWDPANMEDDDHSVESLNRLMKIASSPAIKDCGLNMEYTFHLLCKFKGNFDETLQALLKEAFVVYDYVYAETTPWTTEEIVQFQQSLGTHDRDFYKVSQDLKAAGYDKSVKACVEFYYMWKEMNTGNEVNKFRSMGRRSKKDHQQQISPSFVNANNNNVPCSSNQLDGLANTNHEQSASSVENSSYNLRRKQGDSVMCSSCESVFANTRQLESHACSVHTESHISPANTPDSVQGNIYDFEPNNREFPCRICHKVFTKVKSRNAHMKSHSDKVKHDTA